MKDELTIVIPCKDEEQYIRRTVMSILQQKGISGVKIIIADGGSRDRTIHIIKNLINNFGERISLIKGGSVSKGRNLGASIATTPYILFLDADTTFTRNTAILECLGEMKYLNLDLLSTTPVYRGKFDPAARFLFALNKFFTIMMSRFDPFAVGCFTLIRKQTFEELGGYDESFHQAEDWMLSRKVDPKKFGLIPDLVTQDNRRFKKFGYFRMVGLMTINFLNRNNPNHFRRDQSYWK